MSSVEELYNKLKNDPEFIQKLADALVDKVVIKKLEEVIVEIARLREDQNKMREDFTKEMQKLREDQNKMREEFSQQITKLWEEQNRMREEIVKLNEELVKLREDQNKMREDFTKEMQKLREDQNKMREEFSQQITKLWEEQNKMREEFTREIIKLREDQNRMREEFSQRFLKIEEEQVRMREEFSKELIKLRREMNRYFKQVTALVDNITTTIEDDAQSFLEWLIQKELGYSVKVSRLEVEGLAEIDIFAEFGNYVLLGEVKSRANKNVLTDFMRKVEKLKMARPELFENKKSILVIFTLSPTYDLIQMCKEKKVFLTSGSRNFTEFKDSL